MRLIFIYTLTGPADPRTVDSGSEAASVTPLT